MRKAIVAGGVVGVGALVVAASALYLLSDSVDQPIAFNHRLHIEEVGTECTDCHSYALTGVRATIPNIEICGSCHEEAISESPDDARLIEYVESQTSIPWQKVYRLPDHVYFSHRRHATLGELSCDVCHGVMNTEELPVTRPFLAVTMDWCMDCHDDSQVTNDCIACHR